LLDFVKSNSVSEDFQEVYDIYPSGVSVFVECVDLVLFDLVAFGLLVGSLKYIVASGAESYQRVTFRLRSSQDSVRAGLSDEVLSAIREDRSATQPSLHFPQFKT
jgi:hypothetical protein